MPDESSNPLSATPSDLSARLGWLQAIDPRLVWPHEARDFTPWLLENAERLAEALGIELEIDAAEHAIGGFSLDLIGRDVTNDAVLIVENQLEGTDHSHLGQVLTYAAGTAASTIVWLATSFREEHRQALVWLNESTSEDVHFFGVELQVVRIGDSVPAPLFNVVVEPNDWQKQLRAATQPSALDGRSAQYVAFWTRVLARVHTDHPDWTRTRRARSKNWIEIRSPIPGTKLCMAFAQGDRLRSELYIDSGDAQRNVDIFAYLREARAQLEGAFGGELEWEELPQRRACRIAAYRDGSITEEEKHEDFVDWLFDSMRRLRAAVEAVAQPPG